MYFNFTQSVKSRGKPGGPDFLSFTGFMCFFYKFYVFYCVVYKIAIFLVRRPMILKHVLIRMYEIDNSWKYEYFLVEQQWLKQLISFWLELLIFCKRKHWFSM